MIGRGLCGEQYEQIEEEVQRPDFFLDILL